MAKKNQARGKNKKQRTFINRIVRVYLQHKTLVHIILIIISIILFASGYLISANYFEPVPTTEFEFFEDVARDVYAQGNKDIYEVPEGISLEKTLTKIEISCNHIKHYGKVVATLTNGELQFNRISGNTPEIVLSICFGALSVLIALLVVAVFYDKKIKSAI